MTNCSVGLKRRVALLFMALFLLTYIQQAFATMWSHLTPKKLSEVELSIPLRQISIVVGNYNKPCCHEGHCKIGY